MNKDKKIENPLQYNKGNDSKEPRKYQQKIINVLKKMEEVHNNFSTIVELATGSGKTYTISSYLTQQAINKGNKVLWLAHRDFLLEQALESLSKSFKEDMCPDKNMISHITISGSNKSLSEIDNNVDVIFASIYSMNLEEEHFTDWLKNIKENNEKLYIVIDEAHHVCSGTYDYFLGELFDKEYVDRYALIGLTATPFRTGYDEVNFFKWFKHGYEEDYVIPEPTDYLEVDASKITYIGSQIGDLDGNRINESDTKIIIQNKGNKIKVIDLDSLINLGVVLEPEFIRVEDFDYKERHKKQKVEDNLILKSFVKNISKTKHLGKTIAFFSRVDEVNEVYKQLREKGLDNVYALTGQTRDREYVLTKFEESEDALLLTVDVVSEGFDVKELNTVILVDATKDSYTRLRQRVGRVVRSADEEKDCRVIWYYYEKDTDDVKSKVGSYITNNSGYDLSCIQDGISMKADRERKTYYLTAPKYKSEVVYQEKYDYTTSREYIELLDILKLFSDNKDLEDYEGFYDFGGRKIYVDKVLNEGILQLRRRIHTEYLIIRQRKPTGKITAEDIWGTNKSQYIENVMEICFFLCKPSKKQTFYIGVEDVELIIEYLLTYNCRLPEHINIHGDLISIVNDLLGEEKGINSTDKNELLDAAQKSDKYIELSKKVNEDIGLVNVLLEKIIDDQLQKIEITADKQLEKAKQEAEELKREIEALGEKISDDDEEISCLLKRVIADKRNNLYPEKSKVIKRKHDYTIRLEGGAFDSHLDYLKRFISAGTTWSQKYVTCECSKCNKKRPVVFMNFDSKTKSVSCKDCQLDEKAFPVLKNYELYTDKYTTQVFAQCQIENKHHLVVTETDIEELGDILIDSLKNYGVVISSDSIDALIKDVLCAVAYNDGDKKASLKDIVFLCKKLPKVLAYYLYDRVYLEVRDSINFMAEAGGVRYLSNSCQNENELKSEADKILASYGLNLSDLNALNLYPVRDAIYDCKPYVKVLQGYQGIKPDLLCRMNDFIINQSSGYESYLCGCGGSGADLINLRTDIPIKNEYFNEYGYLITTFYRVLKDKSSFNKLKREVKRFVNYIEKPDSEQSLEDEYRDWFVTLGEPSFFTEDLRKAEENLRKAEEELIEANSKQESVEIINKKIEKKKECEGNLKTIENWIKRFEELLNKSSEELGVASRDSMNKKSLSKSEKDSQDKASRDKEAVERRRLFREPAIRAEFYKDLGKEKSEDNYDEVKYQNQIIKREDILHGVYQRCQALFNWAQCVDDDKIKELDINDEDWAFITFIYLSFPDRQSHDNCFMSYFIKFVANYESYLQLGHERMKSIVLNTVAPRDINKVIGDNTNEPYAGLSLIDNANCVAYCDIPYAETDDTMYVSAFFAFDKFVEALNVFKGDYIVSSRYNICASSDLKKLYYQEYTSDDDNLSDDTKEKAELLRKRAKSILKFYYSFLSKDTNKKFEDKDEDCTGLMDEDRVPKFIVMPYTAKEEKRDGGRVEKKESNNYRLDKESVISDIEKMLERTMLSNIPVEIMLTNIDMFGNEASSGYALLNHYRLSEDVSVIPTLNADITSTNYFAEPIYVVMKYEWYLDRMYENIFESEASEEPKKAAEMFRSLYYNKN